MLDKESLITMELLYVVSVFPRINEKLVLATNYASIRYPEYLQTKKTSTKTLETIKLFSTKNNKKYFAGRHQDFSGSQSSRINNIQMSWK